MILVDNTFFRHLGENKVFAFNIGNKASDIAAEWFHHRCIPSVISPDPGQPFELVTIALFMDQEVSDAVFLSVDREVRPVGCVEHS